MRADRFGIAPTQAPSRGRAGSTRRSSAPATPSGPYGWPTTCAAVVSLGARQPGMSPASSIVGVDRRGAHQHRLRRCRRHHPRFRTGRAWLDRRVGCRVRYRRGRSSRCPLGRWSHGRHRGRRRGRPYPVPHTSLLAASPRPARSSPRSRPAWPRPAKVPAAEPPDRRGDARGGRSSRRHCAPGRSTPRAPRRISADRSAVVPGPVTSMMSSGCHQARRDGLAEIVTDVDEVIDLVGDFGVDAAPRRSAEPVLTDLLDPSDAHVLASVPLRKAGTTLDVAIAAGVGRPPPRRHWADSSCRASCGARATAGGRW